MYEAFLATHCLMPFGVEGGSFGGGRDGKVLFPHPCEKMTPSLELM